MVLTGPWGWARSIAERGIGWGISRALVAAGVFAAALLASSSLRAVHRRARRPGERDDPRRGHARGEGVRRQRRTAPSSRCRRTRASAAASLNGGAPVLSHGPKVIPPGGGLQTARYGDRPFPVVPVDYRDRKHAAGSTAGKPATKINDP